MTPPRKNSSAASDLERSGLDESGLLARAIAGDKLAQAELFESRQGMLAAIVRAELNGRVLAAFDIEDIVQEAISQAACGLSRFTPQGDDPYKGFDGWLRRIAFTTTIDHLRRQRAGLQRLSTDLQLTRPGSLPTPSAPLRRSEQRHALRLAMDDLGSTERRVVALFYVHGRSVATIATELDLTTDAVKKRLERARKRLLAALNTPTPANTPPRPQRSLPPP